MRVDGRASRISLCIYEPFHAFPRHAGKFASPERREKVDSGIGAAGGTGKKDEEEGERAAAERRETESPITFSISGCAELSSVSRRVGTRADYQRVRVTSLFSCAFSLSSFVLLLSLFLSHTLHFSLRLICYSLTRRTSCGPFVPGFCVARAYYNRAASRPLAGPVRRSNCEISRHTSSALSR